MKTLIPGSLYELESVEGKSIQTIQFISKEKDIANPVKLITIQDGTTVEEMLKVCIEQLQYLFDKQPCIETRFAITECKDALNWLDKRTQARKQQGVDNSTMLHKPLIAKDMIK